MSDPIDLLEAMAPVALLWLAVGLPVAIAFGATARCMRRDRVQAWLLAAGLGAALAAPDAPRAETTAAVFTGTLAADRLGGVGGHKSIAGVELEHAYKRLAWRAWAWRLAEGLDDDDGIAPARGARLELAYRPHRAWRLGLHYAAVERETFHYAALGVGNGAASLALLAPLAGERYGLAARLRAPLAGGWFAEGVYEYTGRQDPDLKLVIIGLKLGRQF